MDRERQMELRHFFHPLHPLTLTSQTSYYPYDDKYCYGCHGNIFGFSYSCVQCGLHLHKSCGEQPRELQHPLHPQHPLILLGKRPNHELCYFCNKLIPMGFAYRCSDCNFSLHLKCASIKFIVKAEFHDHPLNLLRKSVSFTCDVCGKEDKDMSYLCLTCPLMVHLKCASLPLTVKHTAHHHPLNLTDSSDDQPINQSNHGTVCLLCVKKVDTDKVYYCSKCNFVAHLDCATHDGGREEIKDKQLLELTSMLENEDSELDDSVDSLAYVVKTMKIGEDKIEVAEEIKHFSHKHDLNLTEHELLKNEKCDGCMLPTFPPFYSCAQCKFFLHKSCADLPRKKRQPLHPHLLTLFPEASYECGYFGCNVCGRDSDGFNYRCEKCWFDVDIQCCLLLDIFTHDGHEHQLILSRAPNSEKCSCCDCEGKVFKCAECEFTLDVRCATLPRTVKYRYFEESFKLCYKSEEDFDGEYYCDVCEEERNPKYWFYYCADMGFPAHIDCILGEHPYLKR